LGALKKLDQCFLRGLSISIGSCQGLLSIILVLKGSTLFFIYLLPISAKNTQEYFNEEFNTSRNFILIDILFN